jgi:uncharacterized membrane protein YciS (DUF1049 family)
MRKPLLLLLLVVLGILAGATYIVSTLIALLFETGLAHAIIPDLLAARVAAIPEARRPIPKILHQTWKNETVPELWAVAQYTCRDLHPDYEYIVRSPLKNPCSPLVRNRVGRDVKEVRG